VFLGEHCGRAAGIMNLKEKVVVIISANVEWAVLRQIFPEAKLNPSPFGEWYVYRIGISEQNEIAGKLPIPVVFIHGGWGKISAAASAQYVIDRWNPELLINLGTCGGFEGAVDRGTIILANRTIVYDIYEQMGDAGAHIAHYTTDIDLTWLGDDFPADVQCALLLSADRDLVPDEIPILKERYQAIAGDWESGAIAWVAARNDRHCLILRGVSDLVGVNGGEAYEDSQLFVDAAEVVMKRLVLELPQWIEKGLNYRREEND
jgi:adenosylhomocysteine nucleosidase